MSSAEAELNALCKAAQDGLGAKYLSEELCRTLPLVGVVQRQGAGKVKHLSIRQLWVQERESRDELVISKLPREHNVADLLTHHYSESEWQSLSDHFCIERRPS